MKKKKRRHAKVRNEPYVYKIESLENGKWIRKCFRVQKKVRDSTGKRVTVSRTCETLAEARSLRDTLDDLLPTELPSALQKFKPLKFKEVFQRFLHHKKNEAGLQHTTIQKYVQTGKHLAFFDKVEFDQIDSRVVDAWTDFLRDPAYLESQRNSRINYSHEFDLFRNIVNYYIEFENEEYRSPIRGKHRKRLCSRPKNSQEEPKFLSEEQVHQLLDILRSDQVNQRDQTLSQLMLVQLETGMRVSEVAGLEFHQLNFNRKEITVNQRLQWDRTKDGDIHLAKGTKGGRIRIIYMSRLCLEVLNNLRFDRSSQKVWVFSLECCTQRFSDTEKH